MRYLQEVEDAVQSALLSALEAWATGGLPDSPSAWVYRAAYNQIVGDLRSGASRRRILGEHLLLEGSEVAADWGQTRRQSNGESKGQGNPDPQLSGDVGDDLLRLLFVCCDEELTVEAQLTLALKTLCGFSIREIAFRLFATEANVYKRLSRARSRLRETFARDRELTRAQYFSRLPAVHTVLYLLFTEGHLSCLAEMSIRRELCNEAIRLTSLLAENPIGQSSETFALLALMHLHAARMGARQDGAGGLILLQEQDRTLWDGEQIQVGLSWLARSAEGDAFSRYHAEAGIAVEHCLAPSFQETRWQRIVECYLLLEGIAPSAVHTLNRAVALAEWQGPGAALALLESVQPPVWLAKSYLWLSVLADLNGRCGKRAVAREYKQKALKAAPSAAVRRVLSRRLGP